MARVYYIFSRQKYVSVHRNALTRARGLIGKITGKSVRVPTLAITASVADPDPYCSARSGFDHWFEKPHIVVIKIITEKTLLFRFYNNLKH